MDTSSDPVQAVYDRLWNEAQAAFAAGQVRTDPYLRAADTRRGLSLIARPDAALAGRVGDLLGQISAFAPGQHAYRADELHVTVLSLISVADGFDLDRVPLDRYRAVFEAVFAQVRPFTIHMRGVSASPDTVLIGGHTEDDALNHLRDRLREALTEAGLGDTLDRRYRSITAHSTILRYRTQPADLAGLAAFLASVRGRDLGVFTVDDVAFVTNDWFMSHDVVRVLARYRLGAGG